MEELLLKISKKCKNKVAMKYLLTLTLMGVFFVSRLTAVGHMRHPFKADLGEK
jgi:hypothetical protein